MVDNAIKAYIKNWIKNRWKVILVIIVSIIILSILIWIGYRLAWTGFSNKTLWDWMQILVIPAVLAGGAYWLNESARKREQSVTEQRTQDTALQSYLDGMAELLLKEKLREKEQYLFSWEFIPENGTERLIEFLMQNYHINWIKTAKVEKIDDDKAIRVYTEKRSLFLRPNYEKTRIILEIDSGRIGELIANREYGTLNIYSEKNPEVRDVARARTLTVLRGLDRNRKGAVLRFLYEADLINKDKIIINLDGADLSGANLSNAYLSGADLSLANLSDAYLRDADLSGADLSLANLSDAYLSFAYLSGAKLSDAYLSGADLSLADLRNANLSNAALFWADLSSAKLSDADLSNAYLSGANLSWAKLSKADLSKADLSKANLIGANLRYANLSWADLSWADLSDADLSKAKYTKDAGGIRGTKWPDGFDPAARGAICVNE